MNKLDKISKRIGKIQSEQESLEEMNTLDEIRSGLSAIAEAISEDTRHDERQSALEKLVLGLGSVIDRAEELREEESESEESSSEKECARLSAEVAEHEKECEELEAKIESMRTSMREDSDRIGQLRAEVVRFQTMYESANEAKAKAEQLLMQSNESRNRLEATIAEMVKNMTLEELSDFPELEFQRDGADKIIGLGPKKVMGH